MTKLEELEKLLSEVSCPVCREKKNIQFAHSKLSLPGSILCRCQCETYWLWSW